MYAHLLATAVPVWHDVVMRRAIFCLLLAGGFDIALLWSLAVDTALLSPATRRVYFEADENGLAVVLDRATAGYVSEIGLDARGDVEVPAGRTIAIAIEPGTHLVVRTGAADLAPYFAVGEQRPVAEPGAEAAPGGRPALVTGAQVLATPDGARLAVHPWDASRAWTVDREWLRQLRDACGGAAAGAASLRFRADVVAIELGTCATEMPLQITTGSPVLLVVAAMNQATIAAPVGGWPRQRAANRPLLLLIAARVLTLMLAIGGAPTVIAGATLAAIGLAWPTPAILVWWLTLPVAFAAGAGAAVPAMAPRLARWALPAAAAAFLLQACAAIAAIVWLDFGTFGNQRIDRAGDEACAVVGYSTVRGDSLRSGAPGLVERLDSECSPCRGQTSRFSREAQTLRWVREVACAANFPDHSGGHLVFLGGGNDDLFYRPASAWQRVRDLIGMLGFALRPAAATDWESLTEQASRMVAASLGEQAEDIAAVAGCAERGGRQFWFAHDFLVWDLERGRPAARQHSFEHRRAAVLAAGGGFVDLLEVLRDRAGIAWMHDFIHPSGYAQRHIADALCRHLQRAAP